MAEVQGTRDEFASLQYILISKYNCDRFMACKKTELDSELTKTISFRNELE